MANIPEEALLALAVKNKGGGGGGTTNYNDLNNQPQIGGVTLIGNKSASDLGLATQTDLAQKASIQDLADKQDKLTAGSNIEIDNNTISVNRWAVPAGDVLYTVITGSGDYGREIHVQRHTVDGTLIDDREYHIDTWGSEDVDDKIRLAQGYAQWNISLLADSKEHNSGYSYTVNPNTTETSNSFTFTLTQEENDNDLIIREELDSAIGAIKDGQSIDSFADVETVLADKADKSAVKNEFGGTLAEWNALTTEEKKEYDAYDITDDYSDDNYIYLPTIYSEEEREVGVWTDGKPLYQKTVVVNHPAYDTNWHSVSHGISNVDSIIRVNGAVKNAESGDAEEFYDLSVYRPNSQTGIVVGATKTNVTYINNWLESATELWVTLQYTKTTDTAGSGTWTPEGQLAHHYSTSEKIVGTWIDGSTVYSKTIVLDSSITINSNSWSAEIDLVGDRLVNISALNSAEKNVFPVGGNITNNKLSILNTRSSLIVVDTFIVEYTKAS